jgi:hypothetical protein
VLEHHLEFAHGLPAVVGVGLVEAGDAALQCDVGAADEAAIDDGARGARERSTAFPESRRRMRSP